MKLQVLNKRKLQVINNSGSPLRYATDGSAGIDLPLYSINREYREVYAINAVGDVTDEYWLVSTGVQVSIPEGHVGLLIARSSLRERGWRLANGVGVIDSDYRGEIRVALRKDRVGSDDLPDFGEYIAQLVIVPYLRVEIEEVNKLPETARGSGGFGSTGR